MYIYTEFWIAGQHDGHSYLGCQSCHILVSLNRFPIYVYMDLKPTQLEMKAFLTLSMCIFYHVMNWGVVLLGVVSSSSL